jgi:hypothetical protein
MRKRKLIGSSKPPLSRRLSAIVENALRPRDAPKAWKRPIAVKTLAGQLGIGYQSLAYYLSARNNIPAFILPDICKALNNYTALNALEETVGRVAYHIPKQPGESIAKDDLRAVQKFIKEVSEALEALSDTLKDDRVEKHELERTRPQLRDVIRECVRLEHWLEQRCEDNPKPVAKVMPGLSRIRTLNATR